MADLKYSKPQRKNFSGLVIVDEDLEDKLWKFHETFNEYVGKILREVLDARHGKRGPEFKKVFEDIEGSQKAMARLLAVSSLDSKTNRDEKWAKITNTLLREKKLLFDRDAFFPSGMPTDFSYKVFEMVGQIIQSHIGLVKKWRNEKERWTKSKEKWKKDNKGYFRIKPLFDRFIEEQGSLHLSRERWHKYYEFLVKNGAVLAKWSDKKGTFSPLSQHDYEKYKDSPNKRIDLLFKRNPEIKKVNTKDKIWRNEYSQFKRRPSFTYPAAYKHPQYYSFKKTAPYTYRNLDLIKGLVEIQMIKDEWLPITFRADKRLRQGLKSLDKPILIGVLPESGKRDHRQPFSFTYQDPSTGEIFLAEPRGVKLVFKRENLNIVNEKHGKPYFYFAIELFKDSPPISKDLTVGYRKREKSLPEGIKVLSVDFGHRNLAAITLSEIKKGKPEPMQFKPLYGDRLVKAWVTDIKGLTIDTIATHEYELSSGLGNMYKAKDIKSRGSHIPTGKKGFDNLRNHIANSKENRFKNGAHIILATALINQANIIVIEWLENYRPTLARPKRHNRRRMQWSVRGIQSFLEQQARPYNLPVYSAPPGFTSRICYRCGSLGVRCILPTKQAWFKYYEHLYPKQERRYVIDQGGNFFYCHQCKKLVNADINASFNLAKVYLGEWKDGKWEVPKYDKKKEGWFYKDNFIHKDTFYTECDKFIVQLPLHQK